MGSIQTGSLVCTRFVCVVCMLHRVHHYHHPHYRPSALSTRALHFALSLSLLYYRYNRAEPIEYISEMNVWKAARIAGARLNGRTHLYAQACVQTATTFMRTHVNYVLYGRVFSMALKWHCGPFNTLAWAYPNRLFSVVPVPHAAVQRQ